MEGPLEALEDAIDLLRALDPHLLGDNDLHAMVVAVERQRARLGRAAAALLGAWDARRVWASDGSRSATARLSRDTACSSTSASIDLRRARQLRTLPVTAAAIDTKMLSLDHVDLLGRANQPHRADRFAADEAVLVEECSKLRFRQATRLVEYWCQRADAEADHGGEPADHRSNAHLHASETLAGTVVVNGVLDPIGGAAVRRELRRLERELRRSDVQRGVARTAAQRRAAALALMAERSATARRDGRPPSPLFTVLLGDASFRELCELASGTVIRPGDLVPWLGSAELETVLFDGPSTVVSVSRRRSFTGAVRRAIEVRDRHCQHPAGCDVPAELCDVDHIVPYSHSRLTSQFNGRLQCPTHNRREDLHDHGAVALPAREVTRLDVLRARIRWRVLRDDETTQDAERSPPIAV